MMKRTPIGISSVLLVRWLSLFRPFLVSGGATVAFWTGKIHDAQHRDQQQQPRRVCVVGGGPCGLFLAGLLLSDPHKEWDVTVLEQAPRQKQKDSNGHQQQRNAFGIGLNKRLVHQLRKLDDTLAAAVQSVGAKVDALSEDDFDFYIASRRDICEQMTRYLEDRFGNCRRMKNKRRLRIFFDEACQDVDMDSKTLRTTRNRLVSYDLLVAADGVNSSIRRRLVKAGQLKEEHYLAPRYWKALEIPPQGNNLTAFEHLRHPHIFGRVLPKHPDGFLALCFYKPSTSGGSNPQGVETAQDLRQAMTDALIPKKKKINWMYRVFGMKNIEREDGTCTRNESNSTIVLDDEAVEQFLHARPGRSHYIKVDQYDAQHGTVALLGDAAHGMYSFLGQGCACGLQNAWLLVDALQSSSSIEEALKCYSATAVAEGHAITDLNLISHALTANGLGNKLKVAALVLWTALQGKSLLRRVSDSNVTYTQLLLENQRLVQLSQTIWVQERVQVPE